MSQARYVVGLCLIFIFQQSSAETNRSENILEKNELDEEFLEVLGSVEAEEDKWFEIFYQP